MDTTEQRPLISQCEGLEWDLKEILPKTLWDTIERRYGQLALWGFGRERKPGFFDLTYWNAGGCYCFTKEPEIEREEGGWFHYHGLASDGDVLCVKLLEVVRYSWAKTYSVTLDRYTWLDMKHQVADAQRRLMEHRRGHRRMSREVEEYLIDIAWGWALEGMAFAARQLRG